MLPKSYSREKFKLQTKPTRLIKATKLLSPKEKMHQVKVGPDDFFSYLQDWCSPT